ncbi:MAG: hypothetical protein ACUVWJ_08445 [Spirochaetota bacterium]
MKAVSIHGKILFIGLIFLSTIGFSLIHAEDFPPTIVLGAYGMGIMLSEEGSAADSAGSIELSGLLGWRKTLSSGGYLAVNSSFDVRDYFIGLQEIDDDEIGALELSLPVGANRVKIDAGFSSSFFGTGSYPGYIRPDWKVEYHLLREERKVQPYGAYRGYLLIQPQGNEDALFQGGEVGFFYRSSVRLGCEVSLGGGFESWIEFPIYNEVGNISGDKRRDYIINLQGKVDGLIGYFIDWQLDGTLTFRLSNANRYLESLTRLDENSESRLSLAIETVAGWSPSRRINLQIGPYTAWDFYFGREALKDDGSLSGEKLNVFTIGSTFRADWTVDDRLYVVLQGSGVRKYSNDIIETGWDLILKGGIEYSF